MKNIQKQKEQKDLDISEFSIIEGDENDETNYIKTFLNMANIVEIFIKYNLHEDEEGRKRK